MYNVGDHVVYPMHGAGVIVAIEEREVLGEKQEYYIMALPIGDMKVMIPLKSVEELGLRQISSDETVQRVYQILQGEQTAMSSNWNRRYRANMEKIKSGDILEVAEVVRNLTIRENEKGLSTGERKMLENDRHILLSELVIAENSTEEEIVEKIAGFFES